MKKGIRIFLAFLAFNFFTQVCFANYAINPEEQKSITENYERTTINDMKETEEERRRSSMKDILLPVLVMVLVINVVIYILIRILAVQAGL